MPKPRRTRGVSRALRPLRSATHLRWVILARSAQLGATKRPSPVTLNYPPVAVDSRSPLRYGRYEMPFARPDMTIVGSRD